MLFRDFDFNMGEFFVFRALAPHVISQICILAWGHRSKSNPMLFSLGRYNMGIAMILGNNSIRQYNGLEA